MEVAFFVDSFPSVSETFVHAQMAELAERGITIDVYAQQRGNGHAPPFVRSVTYLRLPPPGAAARLLAMAKALGAEPPARRLLCTACNPVRFGRKALSGRFFFAAAPLLHARNSYDAVIAHFGPNGEYASGLRALGRIAGPIVTFFHGYDLTKYLIKHGESTYRRLFADGDLFLAISEHWAERLRALGCPPTRIGVHRMGVDCDRIAFNPRRQEGRVELLSVGRLVEKKGFAVALRALAAQREKLPSFHYTIIGDGPLRHGLERQTEIAGLSDCVSFAGARTPTQVGQAMARAHLLIAPSVTAADGDCEGIPVVLMEAMAAGLPVVSSFHSGIPELIDDGRHGRLVAERDVAALGEAIRWLIEHPDAASRLALAARRRVEAKFDTRHWNRALLERIRALAPGDRLTVPGGVEQ